MLQGYFLQTGYDMTKIRPIAAFVAAVLLSSSTEADAQGRRKKTQGALPAASAAVFMCLYERPKAAEMQALAPALPASTLADASPAPILSVAVSQAVAADKAASDCQQTPSLSQGTFKPTDTPIEPASLVKLANALMIYIDMKEKNETLDTPFITLTDRHKKQGRLGEVNGVITDRGGHVSNLKVGTTLTRREAIIMQTMVSANDVAIASAEKISGSEQAFAAYMTSYVRQHYGMKDTTFKNASGMNATGQITTVEDISRLMEGILETLGENDVRNLYGKTKARIAGSEQKGHISLLEDTQLGIFAAKSGTLNGLSNLASIFNIGGRLGFAVVSAPNAARRNELTRQMMGQARLMLGLPADSDSRTRPSPEQTSKPKLKKKKETAHSIKIAEAASRPE